MITLRYYILLLLIFLSVFSQAKSSEIDSLKSVLGNSTGSEKLKTLTKICQLCRFSDASFAMQSGMEGLTICKKNNDNPTEIFLQLNVGLLYYDVGKYEKALEYFITAEKDAGLIFDKRSAGAAMQNIGMVYQTQTFYDKALVNFNLALESFKEIDDKAAIASVYTSIGALYYEKGDNENALDYFLKSLSISEKLNNEKGIADGLNNSAVIYEEMKNYSKAMEFHKKSLEFNREQHNLSATSSSLYNIALIFVSQNEYDNAINYVDSAIVIAKKINAVVELKEYFKTLSEIYSKKNDFKSSLFYYTLFSELKDTIVNQNRNKLIVEMSTKYQTEKKEKENKILQQQNDIQNLSINRQRIINYSVTVGLILVLALAFYIYRGYKQKQKANLQLEEKNILIQEKNKIVEEKNKDITDSIRYAKRLQTAILKPENTLTNYFDDGFILFKPKDIVSGDFYWFEKFGNLSLIAAADCTGHGVPGAFMSIIGCNLLSQAVNEYAITQPAAILNSINKGLTKVLQQKGDIDSFVTDGMDIALCSFNPDKMIVEYSGAYNPMWLIRDNKVFEYTADKFPVGAFVDDQVRMFNCHEIPVQKGDMIYVFSDGLPDQFGGPLGKKFKYKQLQTILLENHKKKCEEQKTALSKAFENWIGNLEQIDDVLVIGIKI